jgi:hypothetical protein
MAGQAISRFQKRRSAAFEANSAERGGVRAKVAIERGDDLPGLRLRIHKARKPSGTGAHRSKDYADIAVDESVDNSVPSEPSR